MNPSKKLARKEKNRLAKITKAAERQANLALVGKLVFERTVGLDIETEGGPTEIKALDFPPAIRTAVDGSFLPLKEQQSWEQSFRHNALTFLGAKQYRQHGLSMKNRPGNKELHTEAIVEGASRSLAVEVDKILNPSVVEETLIPVVPINAVQEAAQL